ncbi:peptide/nickel transport system substrate-binding protein [Kribbella steppae]|uniref:Peptide/nickel transport system substrate-binding protein n=1 Tax=Kribbella steppae TaxID=2512223 RepID=A0A4R2HSB3_9ACTN|nr:ABC transporter substrate-binding protein [Kribbella steppae]TCO34203.1 peptide/nickel transport system substrate-binding protein [Kribbella steppae]
MSGKHLGTALCASAVLVLAGCGGGQNAAQSPVKDQVKLVDSTPAAAGQLDQATWFMPKEPRSLDLDADAANSQSDLIMANVCDRLLQLQPDLTLKPGLAEKYEWKDKTSLVFTIRQGVKFHDGSALTADDVLWSLQRHSADGASESDEYVNVTGVAKTGPNEITVKFKQPDAVFVEAIAGDAGVVFSRKLVEAQGKKFGTPDGTDACTGPFELSEWAPGKQIVLTKSATYWDPEKAAKTDKITFKWGSDDVIVNSLVTGAATGSYLENLSSATQLAGGTVTTVSQGPDTRVWNLMVTEKGALKDVRLRKALALAIDREGVSKAALSSLGQPWKEPVGSGAWGYEKAKFQAAYDAIDGLPAAPQQADIDAAKKLVQEVGQTQPIVVASDGSPVRNVIANAVVDAAQKIGLQATITQIPIQGYDMTDASVRATADLFSDDYFISKNDPVGFYKNGASNSSVQWLLRDPAYDELVSKGRAALEDAERATIAIELAKRWTDAMPWIPVVQSPSTVALSTKVTGVPASGCYRYYPWAADLGTKGA